MKKKSFLWTTAFLFLASFCQYGQELPLKGIADSGRFFLLVNNQKIGTIDFKLDAEGNYQRQLQLEIGGQKAVMMLKIESRDGLWQKMEVKTPDREKTVIINRKNNQGEILAENETRISFEIKPEELFYDNYGPALEAFLLKNYPSGRKDKVKFTRATIPGHFDCELELLREEHRLFNNQEIRLLVFRNLIAGIEIIIYADQNSRILMEYVPLQRAIFIREGYEDLTAIIEEDPLLSRPVFKFSKQTVMIPMRDKIRLATYLYLPELPGEKFPVILIRTPYKKEMAELNASFYAPRGYVVAVQDCRGRFASEGKWKPFIFEAQDGYDTIEWLAEQPWSNGKVGMIGGSYVGWVQLWAAVERPPHLITIIPNVAPPDPFFNIPYEYGAFFTLGALWWAEILEKEATADLSGKTMIQINERKYEKILKELPVFKLDKKILGKKNSYWREWIKNNSNNAYWQKVNFMEKLSSLNLPVFLQSGWFDGDGIGSKLNYSYLKKSKNPYIKLILGPWGHTDTAHSKVGEYEFREALIDLFSLYLKWFDYWLKGIENNILNEPLVKIFVMFANRWLEGNTYPLENTKFKPLYISSEKGANSLKGDGQLSWQLPDRTRDFDQYTYDPADPTPAPVYYFKSEEELEKEKKEGIKAEEEFQKIYQFYENTLSKRSDILVYETPPFEKSVIIAGPLSAILYASSSAPDTDWFVSLTHIDENGKPLRLTKGTLRARFRNSLSRAELLQTNKIYEFTIDLWHTGIEVKKGCRLRVEISSAYFPLFSRNLNTGGHNEMEKKFQKAVNRIYHSSEYPSRLILPVIEPETEEK